MLVCLIDKDKYVPCIMSRTAAFPAETNVQRLSLEGLLQQPTDNPNLQSLKHNTALNRDQLWSQNSV